MNRKWKRQLSTFQDVFINELQTGDWREKTETWDTGQGSRALLSSNPCCTLKPDPRAAQKAPSPPHWARAAISVWQRPPCILCLPCAELEREQWSTPCGHRADDWTPELPFDLFTRDLPRLSLGSQQWVSAVHTSWCPFSVKFKAWIVTQNTRWHGHFSPH